MYTNKKSLITTFVLLVFTCFLAGSAFAGVHESVTNVKNAVENTALSSFKNQELKTAYSQDLEGIDTTIIIAEDETETADKSQLYQDALNTVNKLISLTDGCDANGVPDDEDWIIDCDDSSAVHTALNQLADDINALIQ